ncbi:DNA-protecting protein DprA [bacterium]|nr:DNA-protecting protein DprA [bacterium]
MQKNFEWPALCNFFSIPFSIYLQHRDMSGSQAWTLLRELKEWTSEEFERQKKIFDGDFASFDKTRCLNWGDPRYPANLSRLTLPPACVYYWGDLSVLAEPALSIIGSRQAASCFLNWMDAELGAFLNRNNKLIVSGGARGIDQKATQVALRHRQKCVIVLPCGIEELYPAELAHWTRQENILFLSEYLPRQKMHRHHFIKRNRLVSALSNHLLVVQCAIKSGSMITVRYALEQGSHIATVPDFPGSYESSGNLKLLSEGATLVSDAQDLQDFTSW